MFQSKVYRTRPRWPMRFLGRLATEAEAGPMPRVRAACCLPHASVPLCATGEQLGCASAHLGQITAVVVHPGGQLVASACERGTVSGETREQEGRGAGSRGT